MEILDLQLQMRSIVHAVIFSLLALIGQPAAMAQDAAISIPMRIDRGTYVVPALINGAITLDFVVDSGATDVSIPADVVLTLTRAGTIQEADFIGRQTYVLADGSKVPSATFRIRSLAVGGTTVENITGSVAPVSGVLLLGQSFLNRFNSWSVDNTKRVLILQPRLETVVNRADQTTSTASGARVRYDCEAELLPSEVDDCVRAGGPGRYRTASSLWTLLEALGLVSATPSPPSGYCAGGPPQWVPATRSWLCR